MNMIIISCLSLWVLLGVIFFLIWYFKKDPKLKLYSIIKDYFTFGIAFTALIISIISFLHSSKIAKEKIIPKLQAKPIDIEERISITGIVIDILNYSEYKAKNIFVDIKFNDKPWKKEATKAEHKDTDKLIRFNDKTEKIVYDKLINRPVWKELEPGKSFKLHIGDENKDFLLEEKVFFRNGKGKDIPIPVTETSAFRRSQDWINDLKKMETGDQIKVLIRTVWENEIGKIFDRVVEYKIICTKIGKG